MLPRVRPVISPMPRPRGRRWRLGAQAGVLLGLGLAILGPAHQPAVAGEGCIIDGCSFRKPNLLLLADYSTSMNEPLSQGMTRWDAVEAAIVHLVVTDNGFFDRNFHLALMRFGHDPSPDPGTMIADDLSNPPLVDGQALDLPWYDAMSPDKLYSECVGADLVNLLEDKIPPPLGGLMVGVGTWTRGALARAQVIIAQSKLDHPQDMDRRIYAVIVLTQGAWTNSTAMQTLAPAAEDPAVAAGDLWQIDGVPTHVIYFGAADDLAARTAADQLALAGGTQAATVIEDVEQAKEAIAGSVTTVHKDNAIKHCAPSHPRFMTLVDASSAMLNVDGGSQPGQMGATGWDQAREALAGASSFFDIPLNMGTMNVEDIAYLGLAVYGQDMPGEEAVLIDYGPCRRDNIAWALDPVTSCGDGCDDPWGGPPITWTFVDGSQADPPGFLDPTLSHMPRCDGGGPPCAGSGAALHLGLGLVRAHQAAYHAAALQTDAPLPAGANTRYVNVLITGGDYSGYSTDAQVQAELEAMFNDGIVTYVLGVGDGVDSPQNLATLAKLADWGSGGLLDHYDVNSLSDLEDALTALIEALEFDPCCDPFDNCSINPEQDHKNECNPDLPNEDCDGDLTCALGDDGWYVCVANGGFCGNGVVDNKELCDDGNDLVDDACQPDCTPSYCGDKKVWVGVETCEDGNIFDWDQCTTECQWATCGDGHVWWMMEECDDGNLEDGDGCSSACLVEPRPKCGDGVLDPGESCDDGNSVDDDACSSACTPNPICGDGVLGPGELCDDGNFIDDDGCSNACAPTPVCGDGVLDPGELCDDGNSIDDDACANTCSLRPRCGDGVVDPGEPCDDGNTVDDDACSNACSLPRCGDAIVQADELCDDGNSLDDDACRNDCTPVNVSAGGCECVLGDEATSEGHARALLSLLLGAGLIARGRRRRRCIA